MRCGPRRETALRRRRSQPGNAAAGSVSSPFRRTTDERENVLVNPGCFVLCSVEYFRSRGTASPPVQGDEPPRGRQSPATSRRRSQSFGSAADSGRPAGRRTDAGQAQQAGAASRPLAQAPSKQAGPHATGPQRAKGTAASGDQIPATGYAGNNNPNNRTVRRGLFGRVRYRINPANRAVEPRVH